MASVKKKYETMRVKIADKNKFYVPVNFMN